MKAAVLKKPEHLVVEDIREPYCDNENVIVKVKACGICGSDLRYYKGENPWALHTLGEFIENPPNIIFGHEFAGEVADAINPEYKHMIGKRVTVLAFKPCGICELCKSGKYHLCKNTKHLGHGAGWGDMDYFPGGMAEYCNVWYSHIIELPDNMSYEEATVLDPLSVAIHAVTLSGIKPGDKVLVLGSGPVGLCIAQAVREFGATNVYSTDKYDVALDIAKKVGVNEALDANVVDVKAFIAEKTQGKGVNIVFDTVGTRDIQKLGLDVLACSGTLVNLVANGTEASYRPLDLGGEKRIISSCNNRYEDYLLGMNLVSEGKIDVKSLITHRVPLDEVEKGFNMLLDKVNSKAMKIVVKTEVL